jgi:hypothetical protein
MFSRNGSVLDALVSVGMRLFPKNAEVLHQRKILQREQDRRRLAGVRVLVPSEARSRSLKKFSRAAAFMVRYLKTCFALL